MTQETPRPLDVHRRTAPLIEQTGSILYLVLSQNEPRPFNVYRRLTLSRADGLHLLHDSILRLGPPSQPLPTGSTFDLTEELCRNYGLT